MLIIKFTLRSFIFQLISSYLKIRSNGCRKCSEHPIVVFLRNRVIFMVVASRTTDRQPEQPARDHINAIIHLVMHVAHEVTAERQKSHCRQRAFVITQRQLIGSQLLHDEPIERQVFIEGADHVVAIRVAPRIVLVLEEDVALRVRIPRDV